MRKLLLLVVFFHCVSTSAQELNCLVTINDDQVIGSNKQVFRTLEQTISEFINQKNGQIKTFDSRAHQLRNEHYYYKAR